MGGVGMFPKGPTKQAGTSLLRINQHSGARTFGFPKKKQTCRIQSRSWVSTNENQWFWGGKKKTLTKKLRLQDFFS